MEDKQQREKQQVHIAQQLERQRRYCALFTAGAQKVLQDSSLLPAETAPSGSLQ